MGRLLQIQSPGYDVIEKTIDLLQWTVTDYPLATGVTLTIMASTAVWVVYRRYANYPLPPEPSVPKDTVLLYQFCRGTYCPSMSPFPIKLETYLRMAGVPYVTDLHGRLSSKGKIPWIRYNDKEVADSSFCISFLNKERGIDLSKGLTDQQRASALAFQKLLEEEFYWCGVYYRWSTEEGLQLNIKSFGQPFYMRYIVAPRMLRQCYAQGIGRHNPQEVRTLFLKDVNAISDYMGSNPYFMGDTPTEIDCTVFAFLAQAYWQSRDDPTDNLIRKHYPNLQAYCERMRQRYWPDWNDCVKYPQRPNVCVKVNKTTQLS